MSTTDLDDKALTTVDNPWSPFTHFDEWFAYDVEQGHNTCGLLARVTVTSNDLSQFDNNSSIEEGMKFIIEHNPTGIYRIVYKNT